MTNIKNIGFVGLGIMGKPMAKNLIKSGFVVKVYDRVRAPMDELEQADAVLASSSRECAEGQDAVITMLPDSSDSEAAILGSDGILEGMSQGTIIIDMSSIAPGVSQKIADACNNKGVDFLDAPVSGGEPGAIAGTLAIMVGGQADVFERASSIFDAVGASTVLCGDYGAGNTTKLANQIIVAANIEAVSEALVLVRKAGLDPNVVLQAISGGLAGSKVLDAKGPMMIEGNFEPGFRLRLHRKDLANALRTASELSVQLPVTVLVQQLIEALVDQGQGDKDHSAIANAIEDMAAITISEGKT